MADEEQMNITMSKEEAEERIFDLNRKIVAMEWDMQVHGMKLKENLLNKKKEELESLKKVFKL